jgi:hypothetical protein
MSLFYKELSMESVLDVGQKLVTLCKQGLWREAIESLYDPQIVSIEAGAPPGKSRQCKGIDAALNKEEMFKANHEIHGSEVRGPFPHDDRFIVFFKLDLTAKAGPMAGKRFDLEEAALYTVMDGKIVREEFFYHMPS